MTPESSDPTHALHGLQRMVELLPAERHEEARRLVQSIASLLEPGSGGPNAADSAEPGPSTLGAIQEAAATLAGIREELEHAEVRRLVDAVAHLSATLTATRTRQEERSVQVAAMAFAALAHDIDELVLHHEPHVSEMALVLQEKIERAYAESGIVRFAPRVGQIYDKARHKAIDTVATDREQEDRTIGAVHRRGYERREQILSPALVTIKKLNTPSSQDSSKGDTNE